jgi:hypothetical protein
LFTLLALPAAAARAQSRPEPTAPPPQQVVTLRVTLPTAVGYAMRLLSKADKTTQPAGRRAPRTSNPVLVFTVPVPQLLSGKQTAPEPAPTSKKD